MSEYDTGIVHSMIVGGVIIFVAFYSPTVRRILRLAIMIIGVVMLVYGGYSAVEELKCW